MTDYNSDKVSRTDCTPWRDRETLRHFYHGKGYSLLETAEAVGCTEGTVSKWCGRLDIETRDAQEARDTGTPKELKREEWLRREYLDHERTCADIAYELDVTDKCVSDWLNRHDIPTRPRHGLSTRVKVQCHTCGDSFEAIESRQDERKYCSRKCYYDDLDMPTGADHWSWREGSYHRYTGEEWHALRERCKRRDQWRCQACNRPDKGNGYFDVHHIKPLRHFDNPRKANTLDNVIYLCRACHRRVEQFAPLLPPGL